MSDRDTLFLTGAGIFALAIAHAPIVVAADYLSIEAAQKAIYPNANAFAEVVVPLSAAQKQTIATLAGAQPAHGSLRIWRALQGDALLGHVFIDEVVGRQDFITYAVGIDTSGSLRTIEVLSYRESHGGEIRNRAWRKQFESRSGLAQLRFQTDIKNIAGATLSSEHITQGVRWLVALWQTTLRSDLTTTRAINE